MNTTIKHSRRDTVPDPTPYFFYEVKAGKWLVAREVYSLGHEDADSFNGPPILVDRQQAGVFDLAYDAMAKCAELNGEALDVHPLDALAHLYWFANFHRTGGSRVAAEFLLGLYNGPRFKFDLTDLRVLDDKLQRCCLAVLKLDMRPKMEVHEWLNLISGRRDFGARFEQMARSYGVEGAAEPSVDDPVLEPFKFASPLEI